MAIIEMGNLYMHDTVAPLSHTPSKVSNFQLYGENILMKRAVVNIESHLCSNLGLVAMNNISEVIAEDGDPPDKIFFYGSQGMI